MRHAGHAESISGIEPPRGRLNDPWVRAPFGSRYSRQTKRRTSLNPLPARGTSSRSTLTSLRRASRARWSSSTLGTLLLHRFSFATASSIAWWSETNTDAMGADTVTQPRRPVSQITCRRFYFRRVCDRRFRVTAIRASSSSAAGNARDRLVLSRSPLALLRGSACRWSRRTRSRTR